jgi:hypothetical protein
LRAGAVGFLLTYRLLLKQDLQNGGYLRILH